MSNPPAYEPDDGPLTPEQMARLQEITLTPKNITMTELLFDDPVSRARDSRVEEKHPSVVLLKKPGIEPNGDVNIVGYKGATGDYVNSKTMNLHRAFYSVDGSVPSLNAVISLEWLKDITEPLFEITTIQGLKVYYQEPELYYGENGEFYYTISRDTGMYYCPYIPLNMTGAPPPPPPGPPSRVVWY